MSLSGRYSVSDIFLTSSSVRKARDFSSALGLRLVSMDLPGFLSRIPSRSALLRAPLRLMKEETGDAALFYPELLDVLYGSI